MIVSEISDLLSLLWFAFSEKANLQCSSYSKYRLFPLVHNTFKTLPDRINPGLDGYSSLLTLSVKEFNK